MVLRRIHGSMMGMNDSSLIIICSDFRVLIFFGNEFDWNFQAFGLVGDFLFQEPELFLSMCPIKPSNALKITVDLLLLDEFTNPVQCPDALFEDAPGLFFSKSSGKVGKTGFQTRTDLSTVPGTSSPSRVLCIQNQGLHSLTRCLQGGA